MSAKETYHLTRSGHSSYETDVPSAKEIELEEPVGEIDGDPAWKARNTVHIYTCTHSCSYNHTAYITIHNYREYIVVPNVLLYAWNTELYSLHFA